MAQLSHVTVGDTPLDITAGLAAGCYVAQSRGQTDAVGVLYATAATPPVADNDYFRARGDTFFTFTVGPDDPPTWCKTSVTGAEMVVALASVPT